MPEFSIEYAHWITFGICIFGFLGFVWQFANARGARSRGRRRNPQPNRRADKRKLTRNESRLYLQSQKLLSEGNVQPAARILEQIQMRREAIQALEDAGLIHEAAKILMRMRRSNRAGVVYARHAMWADAAKCFKTANMPLEVAKCAREAGDYKLAGEYFEKASRPEAAAECFAHLGELQHAAQLYDQSGKGQKAIEMYSALAARTKNIASLELNKREIQMIIEHMSDGNSDSGLVDLVINRNKLTEVLITLIEKEMLDQAAELFMRSSNDIGPQLMAGINHQTEAATNLATVFEKVSQHSYAGMVYERQTQFKRAAQAFEKAEDYKRASYCYERCGEDSLAKKFREMASNSAGGTEKQSLSTPFVLEPTTPEPADTFEESDSTQVMDTTPAPNAPPIPKHVVNPPPLPVREVQPSSAKRGDSTSSGGKFSLSPAGAAEAEPQIFAEGISTLKSDADNEDQHIPPPPPKSVESLPEVNSEIPDQPISLDDGKASFHKAKFFNDLDFEQKNKLWNIGRTLKFDSEEVILTYNDEPKGIYVVIEGSVSVYRVANQLESFVDQVSPADSFGELWLLADQPTEVKFVASKNTRIRIVERESFNELLDRDGAIARKIYRRFTNRLIKRLLKPSKKSAHPKAS